MPPTRTVHQGDGVAWLLGHPLSDDHAIVTSLPDVSEVPRLGLDGWKAWFVEVSELVCRSVSDRQVAIFFQTDIKHAGQWIDKAYLVQRGAEMAGSALLWHKVVCRAPAGTVTFGRPAYAHLLCFSRSLRLAPATSTADVVPRLGAMTWARAMGLEACRVAVAFAAESAGATTLVDPFCGVGTLLAVANAAGLHAVGVELSRKRAARAARLAIDDAIDVARVRARA